MMVTNKTRRPKYKTMKFSSINIGESFEFGGNLYVKFKREYSDRQDNAVMLDEYNQTQHFEADELVYLTKAEVTFTLIEQEEV